MGRFWTQPERTFLSACQDICGKLKLDAQKTIPKLLADRGIDRTWKGICYALSSRIPVCEFQEEEIEENRRLVYEALSRLQLISLNAMGDGIVVSDAGVDKWRRTGVAHDFSEVPRICASKRKCPVVEPTSQVPPKSRKTAPIKPRPTRRADGHEDNAQPAEHEGEMDVSGTRLGLNSLAAVSHTQATNGAGTARCDNNAAVGSHARPTHSDRPKATMRNNLQTQVQALIERVGKLEDQLKNPRPLGNLELRDQSRRLAIENQAAREASAKSASHSRKKDELEENHIQYRRREDEFMIKYLEGEKERLEAEKERLRQHYNDQAREMEDYYKSKIEASTGHAAELQEELQTLTGSKLINRTRDGRFPTHYDPKSLDANWRDIGPELIEIFAKSQAETPVVGADIRSLSNINSLLRTAAVASTTPNEDLRIENYFAGISSLPSNYSLILACFMARMLRWCFDTSFHIDGVQCTKMQEVWEAVAIYGGLEKVRTMDMLATIWKVKNQHFRDNEVPQMAKCQTAIFMQEFEGYLPVNDGMFIEELEKWLAHVMTMKLELLVSETHHKLVFISPGTPFNRNWMEAVYESGGGVEIRESRQYRVCLCLSPALVGSVEDASWSDKTSPELHASTFRDALLESRDFIPEEAVKWWVLPGSKPVSKATVMVEEVFSGDDGTTLASAFTGVTAISFDDE